MAVSCLTRCRNRPTPYRRHCLNHGHRLSGPPFGDRAGAHRRPQPRWFLFCAPSRVTSALCSCRRAPRDSCPLRQRRPVHHQDPEIDDRAAGELDRGQPGAPRAPSPISSEVPSRRTTQQSYRTASVTPAWLVTPPIVTSKVAALPLTPAGIVTLICSTPATIPGATPA